MAPPDKYLVLNTTGLEKKLEFLARPVGKQLSYFAWLGPLLARLS